MITLEYPPTTPTHTLTLSSPAWNNTHDINYNTLIRKLKSGQVRSFRDTDWPIVNIYQLVVGTITFDEKTSLKEFLEVANGKRIQYTDHLNVVRTGVIFSAANDIVSQMDDDNFQFSFEFLEDIDNDAFYKTVSENGVDILTFEDDEEIASEGAD